ncbi:MAG: type II secretion system F family protein [Oligoflexia bacterium]|nr:type II secretion system F family protein [Oligoflexia bacterium]
MDSSHIIGGVALGLALLSGGFVVYYLFFPKRESAMRNLMGSRYSDGMAPPSELRQKLQDDPDGAQYEQLKKAAKGKVKQKEQVTLDDKLFRAGYFTSKEKAEFRRMRTVAPLITTPIGLFVGGYFSGAGALIGLVFGALLGFQLPFSILDRRIKARDEEIMYYLPLVIEQIAIGVSSSLDIGPCLQRVVQMADERDTHNVVTELVRHAQHHVRSGVGLEDALNEVGRKSGHNELKHSFLSLSQVAKHGGEITRQLQELADAVGSQRETRIEAKIKKLELEATFPVTLVFCGFIVILLVGFFIQIKSAL